MKTLLIIVAVGLCCSLVGNLLLYSTNNEISRSLTDQRSLVVDNIAFSLESLSYLPVPGPLTREDYSNISIVEICNRHIAYHSQDGRRSVQQLIGLDSTHAKNLTEIDTLFFRFLLFADNLNRLVSENRTATAIEAIDGFDKTMSGHPTDLGWKLRAAYGTATIDEGKLELVIEQTAQIQALLDSMITEQPE